MDRRSFLIVDGINLNLEMICLKFEFFLVIRWMDGVFMDLDAE